MSVFLKTCLMSVVSYTFSCYSMIQQNSPVYQAQAGNRPYSNNSQNQGSQPQAGPNKNEQQKEKNPFLEYYTRQGTSLLGENSSFLFQDGQGLIKKSINTENLKKAVIVFFGEWCPHCNAFLTSFSKNIDLLRLAGVDVIFVAVPTIDKLRKKETPNIDDFNNAENKIASFGIKLSSKRVFVTMIADRMVLAKCGIEGLPVAIVVKNEKEVYRAVGENTTQKLNLSDQNVFKQFLEIFDDETHKNEVDANFLDNTSNVFENTNESESMHEFTEENKKSSTVKASKKRASPKKSSSKNKSSSKQTSKKSKKKQSSEKIDVIKAKKATEKLNSDYYLY